MRNGNIDQGAKERIGAVGHGEEEYTPNRYTTTVEMGIEEKARAHPAVDQIRKGIVQARINERNSRLLLIEILAISVVSGLASASWWVFFLSLLFLLGILGTALGMVLVVLLSGAWGFIVGAFVYAAAGINAGLVCGLVTFMVVLGGRLAALRYYRDWSE